MARSGIYQILNTESKCIYIGSAENISKRWSDHKSALYKGYHGNSHLQHAWNKYGEDVFEFSVLMDCPIDMLIYYEQQFINQMDVRYKYNISPVAGSSKGIKRSEEFRRKLGNRMKGIKMSDKNKQMLSERNKGNKYFLGHKHSEETKDKIRQARLIDGIVPPGTRKFSDEEEQNIYNKYKNEDITQKQLGKIFGVHPVTICMIIKRCRGRNA